MTFTISVTGTMPKTDGEKDEAAEARINSRIAQAVQRLYGELQRAGVDVVKFDVGGHESLSDLSKTLQPFEARNLASPNRESLPAREDRVETGQPGAKSALALSYEAGTQSTGAQPSPNSPTSAPRVEANPAPAAKRAPRKTEASDEDAKEASPRAKAKKDDS